MNNQALQSHRTASIHIARTINEPGGHLAPLSAAGVRTNCASEVPRRALHPRAVQAATRAFAGLSARPETAAHRRSTVSKPARLVLGGVIRP